MFRRGSNGSGIASPEMYRSPSFAYLDPRPHQSLFDEDGLPVAPPVMPTDPNEFHTPYMPRTGGPLVGPHSRGGRSQMYDSYLSIQRDSPAYGYYGGEQYLSPAEEYDRDLRVLHENDQMYLGRDFRNPAFQEQDMMQHRGNPYHRQPPGSMQHQRTPQMGNRVPGNLLPGMRPTPPDRYQDNSFNVTNNSDPRDWTETQAALFYH
eukprot:m.349128 g.349128  ORF g.349128 m.349128 type:complete len:206 (+) comp40358_c0_seq1:63-680(+)